MPKTRWGEAQLWIAEVSLSKREDCILWPFATSGQTKRPTVWWRGRLRPVGRAVLEARGMKGYKRIAKTLGISYDAARYHARIARKESL